MRRNKLNFLQNFAVKLNIIQVKSPSLSNAKITEFPMAILTM